MGFVFRRLIVTFVSATLVIIAFRQFSYTGSFPSPTGISSPFVKGPVKWKDVPLRYPISSTASLPSGTPTPIPRIQHDFGEPTEHHKAKNEARRKAVKDVFMDSWEGYKKNAWLQDEIMPVTGSFKNPFGSRAATLVDTLDTLIFMGLDEEFNEALKAVKKIDFSTSKDVVLNLFETNIRYLGGLLSAYDLSEKKHRALLEKATQLGDMLYMSFDTPNRFPITRWDWANGALGGEQQAPSQALSAELGSLSLEFTRLSQLTGDHKYFDAIQRITDRFEKDQDDTLLPGLWPVMVHPHAGSFGDGRTFTFGGMADSLYEYLPKEHLLLGGLSDQYRRLYELAIATAKEHLFFRPLTPQDANILISGTVMKNAVDHFKLTPQGQHLTCFAGGMVAMGAKIFNRTQDLAIAQKLVDGCIWTYDSMPTGIMPELFDLIPCSENDDCRWSDERWHEAIMTERGFARTFDVQRIIREDGLPPGFTAISDKRYLLRPEAIESIFILYRITGDTEYQNAAWRMFERIRDVTKTEFGHASIADVTCERVGEYDECEKLDSCESFWFGETLKYFYLIFSDSHLGSLDEFVYNTEAHPLRRPHPEKRLW